MACEQYYGGAEDDDLKKGGYKSQLSDDTPGNYIGTSHTTEDPPRYFNSDEKGIGSFDSSVAERISCRGVATRKEPIRFETGDKREYPKSILWEKFGQ